LLALFHQRAHEGRLAVQEQPARTTRRGTVAQRRPLVPYRNRRKRRAACKQQQQHRMRYRQVRERPVANASVPRAASAAVAEQRGKGIVRQPTAHIWTRSTQDALQDTKGLQLALDALIIPARRQRVQIVRPSVRPLRRQLSERLARTRAEAQDVGDVCALLKGVGNRIDRSDHFFGCDNQPIERRRARLGLGTSARGGGGWSGRLEDCVDLSLDGGEEHGRIEHVLA
jgi:hypothetical protein